MRNTLYRRVLTTAFLPCLLAAGPSYSAQPVDGWSRDLGAGYFFSTDADFDSGGNFSSQYFTVNGSTEKAFGRGGSIGFGVSYTAVDYDFDDVSAAWWDRVDFLTLSLPLSIEAGESGRIMLVGSVGFASEQEADLDDGIAYNAAASYMHLFSPTLSVGIGAGYSGGLEDSTLFPLVLIRWQISDHLLLANPFRPGPFGPAGLELSYRPDGPFDFGIGGVYRSLRFALGEEGSASSGYAEFEDVPVFLRVGWNPRPAISLDAYFGVTLGGQLSLDDDNGRELLQDDYDAQPIVGLNISGRL